MPSFLLLAFLAQPTPYLHDTEVLVDSTLASNTEASAVVSVRRAATLFEHEPIEGAEVRITIGEQEVGTQKTDRDGRAVVRFVVPVTTEKRLKLVIHTKSMHGEDRIERSVSVLSSPVLSLRTDRAVYGPGQTIRYVVAVLNRVTARPMPGVDVSLLVKDPKGTQIWRGVMKTDATGFVATKLPLGEDLVLGKYTIEARVGTSEASRTVAVREVDLPPFFVQLDTKAGHVTARHAYGEPVVGEVVLRDERGGRVTGTLDAFGRFAFDPSKYKGEVRATVTDGANRTNSATDHVSQADDNVDVAVVFQGQGPAHRERRHVTIITTNRSGALVPANVTLAGSNVRIHDGFERRSQGAVRYEVTATKPHGTAELSVTTNHHQEAQTRVVAIQRTGEVAVATDRTVYDGTRTIVVRGRVRGPRSPLVLTLVRKNIALASAIVAADETGAFSQAIDVPPGVFGLASVRVHELGWDHERERAFKRSAATSVYLAPQRLGVALDGRTRHRPGTTAKIRASVLDDQGKPARGVGLFVSVIDERSLALGTPQQTLRELLTNLDLKSAKVLGAQFAVLLEQSGAAPEAARAAVIETLPVANPAPLVHYDGLERLRAERRRANRLTSVVLDSYTTSTAKIGRYTEGVGWEHRSKLEAVLKAAGEKNRRTPWGRPIGWAYTRALAPQIAFGIIAGQVTDRRLRTLAGLLAPVSGKNRLHAYKSRAPYLVRDAWGHSIVWYPGRVRSPGPDGVFDTPDDREASLARGGFGVGYGGLGSRGSGLGGGGFAVGMAGLGRRSKPLLRDRFDEAVLWRSGIRTDVEGMATLEIPFSDSVTGWKLAVDAISEQGAIGRAEKHLETFLPLSVDVAVPHQLTIGDRFTMRAVVSNHTEERRELDVKMTVSGSLKRTGDEVHTIVLPAGANGAVSIPTEAISAGAATIDLVLSTKEGEVDRVRRTSKVVGPGRVRHLFVTHRFQSERETVSFEVPEAPEAHSASATLRLFRSPLDQALDGIEGLLREPHGCFEQTTSTTYPNLLVLQLLQEEGPTRARAYELVQKGYQRLVSYEVEGGGFSWFGQAPAHKALTAYGLMEFADMAKVYPVDPALIARTQAWLIQQQDPDGSWPPDDRQLHDWSAVMGRVSATAFVSWALAESGYRGRALDRGLSYLGRNASKANSPYVTALYAAALGRIDKKGPLPKPKKDDAGIYYGAGSETLFYAKGRAADIQVTALAAMTNARLGRQNQARSAFAWLWSAREPRYGWGTPQGTVMALKTAVEIADTKKVEGQAPVAVDGRSVGAIELASVDVPTLKLPPPSEGRHAVDVGRADGLLGDLRVTWRSKAAPAARDRGIAVQLVVPDETTEVGDSAQVTVAMKNSSDEDVVMPTVVVPIPPGFTVDRNSLKQLTRVRRIDRFESDGQKLTFYLRKLAAGQTVSLSYQLTAVASCDVAHRGAMVYAYYDPSVFGESATYRIAARRQ